jgi:hypothetical protein
MNNRERQSELDWLAFCYAAGELSSAETEQFEVRLADDQAAREALARAVELTQIVAAAEAQSGEFITPAVRSGNEWNTRLSWMAIGGLASLLVALLWSGVVGPTWTAAQRRFSAASQHELALAWNMTRTEIANVREAGLWLPGPAANEADDEPGNDLRIDEMGVDESPSWMTAAVFGQATDDSDQPNQPFSNERLEN